MKNFVEHGLRAQLRNANLLTGQLYVEIDFMKNQPHATMDLAANPPEIPTAAGGLGELQESIERIARNLEKVPFEQIGKDVRQALADLHATLAKIDTLTQHIDRDLTPEMRKALEQARHTMSAAEAVLSTDSPVQGDLRDTLDQVNRAAESLRTLTDYLERHPESLIRGRRGDAK
jgi:paraquat-inducible protein B